MMEQNSDIDAWRRVHRQLTLALIQSRDNIAAELTKKRYLLEEMNRCKMQNTQKSALGSSGSGKAKKKAAAPKKVAPPKKEKSPGGVVKVKKVMPSSTPINNVTKPASSQASASLEKAVQPKLGLHKADKTANDFSMAGIVALPSVNETVGEGILSENKNEQADNGGEADASEVLHPPIQQYAEISPQQLSQMYYPPAPYSMFPANLSLNPMELAFQMMQQLNQHGSSEGGDGNDSEPKTDSTLKHI